MQSAFSFVELKFKRIGSVAAVRGFPLGGSLVLRACSFGEAEARGVYSS